MQLARPFSLRLSPELTQWLDAWRGDVMSRSTAIRLLLEDAMRFHRDGILPPSRR
jgi:hypothetical protein